MRQRITATRLTIVVSEDQHWRHRPAYSEIVRRAHSHGLPGATVIRGIEGYGASGRLHSSGLVSLSEHLPVAVIIVAEEEQVDKFLGSIEDVLDVGGLVLLDPVHVIGSLAGPHQRPGRG